MAGFVHYLHSTVDKSLSLIELKARFAFRGRAATINVGVPTLKRLIGYAVWHEHSPLEVDRVVAWRNAEGFELAAHAVITDTAGFAFTRNKMQFPASVADDPIPYWHDANMLRQRSTLDQS